MTRVKLPEIPKGNLGKVYVLSERAASALFEEGAEIVREHWSLPNEYLIPSREGTTVKLKSSPYLWLPKDSIKYSTIGIGSLGIGIGYEGKNKRGTMSTGCGEKILEFLCEAKRDGNLDGEAAWNTILVPNSHIFVYSLHKPDRINLPSEVFQYGIVSNETAEDLNRKVKPAFDKIVAKIESSMEKRGAVLTRGWLDSQFVI